jgi:hypothetical protein
MKSWKGASIPLLQRRVDATSKNIAEGILRIGADGVVRSCFAAFS